MDGNQLCHGSHWCQLAVTFLLLSNALCSTPIHLYGSGGVLPSRLFWDAFFAYRFVKPNVQISYTATTSQSGLCRLRDNVGSCPSEGESTPSYLDFAGSDVPLSKADYERHPDLQLYPTVASAVVPIFNLNGLCDTLTLTTDVLVGIFKGNITLWDDPAILQSNPQCALPANQTIEIVIRSDQSGITDIFTKSLAALDTSPSPPNASWTWAETNMKVTKREGNQGIISYVIMTPYTMSYAGVAQAFRNDVKMVRLKRYNGIVQASAQSVGFAVLEQGLSFGNNGDDPAHLTADIHGAQAALAWPIAGYSYLAVRKSSLRPGSTCQRVAAMVDYWRWFWTSDVVKETAVSLGFSPLPQVVRDVVLQQFLKDMMCNGQRVWQNDNIIQINGCGPISIRDFFQKLPPIYRLVKPNVMLNYTNVPSMSNISVSDLLHSNMFVISRTTLRPGITDGATLTFAGTGLVVISRFRFVLDGITLALILQGSVTKWQDPSIQLLNPKGIFDTNGGPLSNASLPIKIIRSPLLGSSAWKQMMQKYVPSYTGAAVMAVPRYSNYEIVQSLVAGELGALSVITFTGEIASGLTVASFQRDDGTIVEPSWKAIRACASSDVWHMESNSFRLHESKSSECYPLSESIYLTVKKSACDSQSDAQRTATIAFVEWLFSNQDLDAALQEQNMAPLSDISATSTAANQQALEFVSCHLNNRPPFGLTETLLIFVPVGTILLGLVAFGSFLLWRATSRLRAIRKQFSNDNVAQHCAEAIARFDFEAVAWLDAVAQPNKVQSAFVRIIHLLKEVKPYIPDQLLQSLVGGNFTTASLSQSRTNSGYFVEQSQEIIMETMQSVGGPRSTSPMEADQLTPIMAAAGPDSGCGVVLPPRRTRLSVFIPPSAKPEHTSKQCSYMFLRFGFMDGLDLQEMEVLQGMSAVAAHIIEMGKRFKGTIDRVTANSVAFHWGVDSSGASTLQATKAALEMAKAGDILSGLLHDAFSIQIGLGQGLCMTSTLCAAGHRFFIISGKEVTLPVDLVTADMPKKSRCAILITNEVYQKVQYWVNCFPRVLFRNILLWEPVGLANLSDGQEEWMYQLQQLNQVEKGKFSGKVMEKAFRMALSHAPPEDVRQEVANIKERYGDEMGMQDILSLENLLAMLPAAH